MALKTLQFRANLPSKLAISDIKILNDKFDKQAVDYRSRHCVINAETQELFTFQALHEKSQEKAKPRLLNHTSSALEKINKANKTMVFITSTIDPKYNQDENLLKQGYVQPQKILDNRNRFNKFFKFIRHSSYAKKLRKIDKQKELTRNSASYLIKAINKQEYEPSLFKKSQIDYFNMFEFTQKYNLHTHTPFFIPSSKNDIIEFVKTVLSARKHTEIARMEVLVPQQFIDSLIKRFELAKSQINDGCYTLPYEKRKNGNIAIFKPLNDQNEKEKFVNNCIGLFRLLGINNYRTSRILISKDLFNKFAHKALRGADFKNSFYHFDRLFYCPFFDLDYKIEQKDGIEQLIIFAKQFGVKMDNYEQKLLRWL